jgi:SSS family solute:Na+ symporter
MESPKAVQRQYTWSSVSFMMRFLIPSFWGICAFVFVTTQAPDLYKLLIPQGDEPQIMGNLYAMPAVLGRILPIGVLGILTAAMIAAFMSTHDSYLLCWSSVITQDIIAPLKKGNMSTKSRIFWTRAFIIIIGGYIWFWGIFYKGDEKIWDYMQITGAIYFSGAFSLLVCGLYWKRASSTGAVISLFCGLGAILGLSKVQEFFGIEIASARIGLGVIALTVIGMVAGSLLFPDKEKPMQESTAD